MSGRNKKKRQQESDSEEEIQNEQNEDNVVLSDVSDMEDPFEDELEIEDDFGDMQIEEEGKEGDEGYETYSEDEEGGDSKKAKPPTRVWRPDRQKKGAKKEELTFENTAYDMFHRMTSEWPCLSFDIVQDDLGFFRERFPLSCMIVSGTQADNPANNKIVVMKMSQMHRTKYDSDEESSDELDNDDVDNDDDPILEHQEIKHNGAINRIRSMRQQPNIVACWSDTGCVEIFDISVNINRLNNKQDTTNTNPKQMLQSFNGHRTEGYALDWSPLVPGRLLSGDCSSKIHLWEPKTNLTSWAVGSRVFDAHKDSVEDLQWSPTEETVFASCSVDQTIRIWDCRQKSNKEALCIKAHDSDVNVISWNKNVTYLLASGSDDGEFKVWDLRSASKEKSATGTQQASARFQYHHTHITSIEWHPTDESTIAVTSADNQLTIWDMSVENDTDEGTEISDDVRDLPPQLMFIHSGLDEPKEVHWHHQLKNVVLVTDMNGFNIFRPENLS